MDDIFENMTDEQKQEISDAIQRSLDSGISPVTHEEFIEELHEIARNVGK